MGPPPEVEFLGFFVRRATAAVPEFAGLPTDPPPLPFQLADPEKLRRALADAELEDVRVETANHRLEFQSAAHLWNWVTSSNPIGAGMVADLTEEQRATALEALDRALRARTGGDGPTVLDNSVNVGIGTKPPA